MKNHQNKGGFTLIELLVVVLIIGILSSIALPQYTKAVEKSRATEAMSYAAAWVTGQQIYLMSNGAFTTTVSNLDISLPETLKYFTASTHDLSDGEVWLTVTRSTPNSMPYRLQVTLRHDSATGKFTVIRVCKGTEKVCTSISNGATCTNYGGDGDVPWCYKA